MLGASGHGTGFLRPGVFRRIRIAERCGGSAVHLADERAGAAPDHAVANLSVESHGGRDFVLVTHKLLYRNKSEFKVEERSVKPNYTTKIGLGTQAPEYTG
jgi:hypothetical protein